ncbi:proton-conducting transporter transmembrane domain-containing protein [Methylomarinum vadi]|uniref:proton-conducting transporter transmembrane domain-containing protein n=1 Tax=Methylomarinum vadi TaxID=438855 RepID=UPI0004DF90B3|nr:proton-conducting transporter membrane subunit [Methylomarinum vadi]
MHTLIALLVVLGPSLMLALLFISNHWADRHPQTMNRIGGTAAIAALTASLFAVSGYLYTGRVDQNIAGLDIYFDSLSATMLVLVAAIGTIVIRYARNYLDGDPGHGHFQKWLGITVGSVLILVVSGNLIQFTLAWMATSLSLHRLLLFYPERPAARIAAHKKFVISRLGDISLIAAMFAIYQAFGSLHFSEIFAAADAYRWPYADESGTYLTWAGFALVLGAALKSAQFPFHSWLPEVMETPTPVSALMHAGIINAGGFLIVRMSHVMVLTPAALNLLAVIGAVTALFGALAMLTQTNIKKSLAFSTIGQMGFMMLQCGLGAFSSAILHIVAHGLYKAHAFLSSGSIVDIAKSSWTPAPRAGRHPGELLLAFFAASLLTYFCALGFGLSLAEEPGIIVLGAILQIALTYLLWNALETDTDLTQILRGIGLAAGAGVAYFSLQILFMHLLNDAIATVAPARGVFSWLLLATVLACFIWVLMLQVQFPGPAANRVWQAAYVHFYNGFYISSLANRLLQRIWPDRGSQPSMRSPSARQDH